MKQLRPLTVLALSTALLAGCSREPESGAETAPGEWRQWRGENAQGRSAVTALPARWSGDSANVRWKAPVPGLGNSSPIVSGGRVFVTTSWGKRRGARFSRHDPLNRALLAYDLATGELLWEQVVFQTDQEKRHHLNTFAAVTPAADGERVYVYFGMGLAAYDYDGNQVWSKEVDPHYIERARYGVVSSPIVVGDAVIIVRDDEWGGDEIHDISWLAAYDRRTGRELWRSENDETCCSYATPIVRETSSGPELIFPSTPFIAGYDPETGERLWTIEHTLRQVVPTALLDGDILILPGSVHMRSVAVWRLSGEGKNTTAESLWGTTRSSPKLPSPVIVDGKLVVLTDNGVVAAYDAASGARRWQKRLKGGNYHASLITAGGRIYATSVGCETTVLAANGRLISVNQIPGNCEASVAVTDGALLIRTAEELYCIEKFRRPEGEATASSNATADDAETKRQKRKQRKQNKGKRQADSPERADG